jgi:pyruvate/2-oxoglutarate dehydrogenase complex dihydrolipoamide acyltransferase (E2) component
MKWSLHLPSAFLSLTPSNHRPGVTRMTTDSHSGGDDGASSSITAVTPPPRESTAPAPAASAGKKSSSSRSRRRLFSFAEARRIARGHGFDSKEEFHEYSCPGAYQIPKDADVVWKEVRCRSCRSLTEKPTPPGGRMSLSPLPRAKDVPSRRCDMEWIFYSKKHTTASTNIHRPPRIAT